MKNYMSEKIQSGKQAGKNGLQHVIYGFWCFCRLQGW